VVPKVVLHLWSSGEFLRLPLLLQTSSAFYVRLQWESLITKLLIEVELEKCLSLSIVATQQAVFNFLVFDAEVQQDG